LFDVFLLDNRGTLIDMYGGRMKNQKFGRSIVLAATILCLFVAAAYGQQADKKGKKEFQFKGKVEKVDPNAKTVLVNNENIPGWMSSMSMSYTVDNPEVLKTVKPGDQVTAKVYEGDFKTLYDLKVAPPSPGKK
jgi:Cu/Ag efflux protein CusF